MASLWPAYGTPLRGRLRQLNTSRSGIRPGLSAGALPSAASWSMSATWTVASFESSWRTTGGTLIIGTSGDCEHRPPMSMSGRHRPSPRVGHVVVYPAERHVDWRPHTLLRPRRQPRGHQPPYGPLVGPHAFSRTRIRSGSPPVCGCQLERLNTTNRRTRGGIDDAAGDLRI